MRPRIGPRSYSTARSTTSAPCARSWKGKGYRFRTASDTEVLLHGYDAWGSELPGRLEGMFAFAVWDAVLERLVLCRDRAGQKPLFVYRDEHRIAFASELGALQALPGADLQLGEDVVQRYLLFGYVPSPDTFHARITKHAPATWTEISRSGETRTHRYWKLDWSGPDTATHDSPGRAAQPPTQAQVRDALTHAVSRRLVSDVPLGAFLSGGLDSSIVVGLMSQLMDRPVRTFSIGFADSPGYDETAFARMASERFGTEHTEFIVDPTSLDLLDDLLDAYDEPFGDSSAIPTWLVSRATREHVTVALTGDGGDELFAGYPRFLGQMLASRIPRPVAAMAKRVGAWLPQAGHVRSPLRRATRFADAACLSESGRLLRWIGFFSGDLDILRPEARRGERSTTWEESFTRVMAEYARASVLTRTLAVNFDTYLLDDLLVKADRCSMAHGLELRAPFLDSDVMRLSGQMHDSQRIKGRTLKWMLKESFSDLVPPEIRNRPKMGFGIPLPNWLRGAWREPVMDRLGSSGARILQWVRAESLKDLLDAHMSGRFDRGHQLWALLTLEAWLERLAGR